MNAGSPERTRLPGRRPLVVHTIEWLGITLMVGIGYDSEGNAREVFVNGHKVGSDIEALAQDACILVSVMLQSGHTAKALSKHLSREGIARNAKAASLLGLLTAKIAEAEATEGAAMRAAYAALHARMRAEARQSQGDGPPPSRGQA